MTRRFRVVHLIETLGYGGAERLLCTNLAHLDRERFEHVVIYLSEPDPLRREIESLGVRCIRIGFRHRGQWPLVLWRLRRQLAAVAPDLLHTHLIRTDICGRVVARTLGIPVVCTIHESPYYPEVYIDNPGLNRAKYALMKQLDGWTARRYVDEFIVVSRFSGSAAQKYLRVPPERLRLIYNALDPDRIEAAPIDRQGALRQELGIAAGERVITHVGRMAPQKGHRYLLHAFARVLASYPNTRLVLRGDGPLEPALHGLAAELDIDSRVTFARPIPHSSWLVGLGDVFVFPSLYEGFGIALLEAMAMGIPAVASDIAPLRELVEDERSGLLVPPRDPDAIATALMALLGNPDRARSMGVRAREIVREKFDIRRNAAALQSMYAARLSSASGAAVSAAEIPS